MIQHKFNGLTAVFAEDENFGVTTFTIVPEGMEREVSEKTLLCKNRTDYGKRVPENMFQVAFTGDSPSRDFSAGHSYRNSEVTLRLKVTGQKAVDGEEGRELVTFLASERDGIEAEHHVFQKKGCRAIECWNTVKNVSGKAKMLEYLPSFSLSYITPFDGDNDPDKILMHRFRNYWSGEARRESLPVSHFAMEDTWSYYGYRMERFGQVGTMPSRGFLPFVAFEDIERGIVWAAKIEAPESWQIEAGHRTFGLHMSGGIADYGFGHWRKNLENGQSFTTRRAFVTAVKGTLLDACTALAEYEWTRVRHVKCEDDLPIIYNEYLYSNGNPTIEGIQKQLPLCKELGVRYYVIDDGWYTDPAKSDNYLGDWLANGERFPSGIAEFSDLALKNGMKPGIWYEFENVTQGSKLSARKELMHTRDGMLIRHENRIFLDFRKEETIAYLTERVIGEIRKNRIQYIKIDYNENIGLGVDGAESLGEGLRQHMEKVLDFYRTIRRSCPDLVMEVCSSGGMRHEPMFMSIGNMVSFSDIHFMPEGAVVACDLHHIMLPRQMQVWSYIAPHYDEDCAIYYMAQGMLGRLCLSGDLNACKQEVRQAIKNGTEYYNKIKHVIRDGKTISVHTEKVTSLRNLHSAFSLTRMSADGMYALFYAFRVRGNESEIIGELPDRYQVVSQYGKGKVTVSGQKVIVVPADVQLFATVVLLKKCKRKMI